MVHLNHEHFQPIRPGTILHKVPTEQKWNPTNLDDYLSKPVRTRVPARLHLSVLDMTRFSPGNPGGGGIGYAIQMYATSEVVIKELFISEQGDQTKPDCDYHEPEITVIARRSSLVEHISRVLFKHLGISGKIDVMGAGHDINHMGLGSTSALVTSVALSLNHALGNPYAIDRLREVIGYNFVEEWENGLVIPGFETGVAPFVGIHGGFGVISDTLHPVADFRVPENYDVIIALVEEEMSDVLVKSPNAGISETELLMNRARALDERDRDKKAYEILMRLIPAADSGDLKALGESVWNLQHMGSKVAEIEHHAHAQDIYETMKMMRDHGSLVTGMSSVGPAISALVPEGSEIGELLEERGYRVLRTHPDSHGMQIE